MGRNRPCLPQIELSQTDERQCKLQLVTWPSGSETRGGEEERARSGQRPRSLDLLENVIDVDAAVRGTVRLEAARRLLELTLAPRAVAAAGVVPGDCDMDEPLQEVPLALRRFAPLLLELLVRLEVLPRAEELQSAFEGHVPIIRVREGC